MAGIEWHSSMIYARDSSWTEKKPILLDFYNPESLGCKKMDKESYAQARVVKFVNDHFVPLRLDHEEKPFSRDYNLIWTPTLIILDQEGRQYQRTIGFQDEDELVPNLMLGVAKVYFCLKNYNAAKLHLDEIIAEVPQSGSAPEALYFLGVNQFKHKDDPAELRKMYESLQEQYPASSWAKGAVPFRGL